MLPHPFSRAPALRQSHKRGGLGEHCTLHPLTLVCRSIDIAGIFPVPYAKKVAKRWMLIFARAEKKDRQVRAGLRDLKFILGGHGMSSKAQRKETKHAAQTKRRALEREEKVMT
jgi:hypothetical protein